MRGAKEATAQRKVHACGQAFTNPDEVHMCDRVAAAKDGSAPVFDCGAAAAPGPGGGGGAAVAAAATAVPSASASAADDGGGDGGSGGGRDGAGIWGEPQSGAGEVVRAGGASPSRAFAPPASESVKVFVRIRPLIRREVAQGFDTPVVTALARSVRIETEQHQLSCAYDGVLDTQASQADVYEAVKDCAESVVAGYNSTLFAYGQTGSGKTHTMFGPEDDARIFAPGPVPEVAGVIPRAVRAVFEGAAQLLGSGEAASVSVFCSFVQVYNETLYDLLQDPGRQHPLALHEDRAHGIYVEGLSEYEAGSAGACLKLLRRGEEHRAIRATKMNFVSSRSHSVFQLLVERRAPPDAKSGAEGVLIRSKLNLVDLAGSEKWKVVSEAGKTMTAGHITELQNINLSLHTLGRCISKLADRAGAGAHVPFRDSKLTRLLQDSLGGNTRTRLLATLAPSPDCVDECISTLKFADRAKQVMVHVRVNEEAVLDEAAFEAMRREVNHLRGIVAQLEAGGAVLAGSPGGKAAKELVRQLRDQNAALRDENDALRGQLRGAGLEEAAPAVARRLDALGGGGGAGGQLAARSAELEAALRAVEVLGARFFAFEIEEEELRAGFVAVSAVVAAAPPAAPSPPRRAKPGGAKAKPGGRRGLGAKAGAGASSTPLLPALTPPRHAPKEAASASSAAAAERTAARQPALSPLRHAAGPPSALSTSASATSASADFADFDFGAGAEVSQFRVRGKDGAAQQIAPAAAVDEEKAIRKELKAAKKRMAKHLKLQQWLKEKEERELAALQAEQDQLEAQEHERQAQERKFRARAKAQKKKIDR
jgi:kinesin family protein 3/17